jgi:APA family basic amino acid/polyamine antiporter
MIITTVISIIVYTFLTISILMSLGSEATALSKTPLLELSKKIFGNNAGIIFKSLAIISLTNTLLIASISGSRYIHGVIENNVKDFNKIDMHHQYKTPTYSIVIMTVVSIFMVLSLKKISFTALYANLLTLIVFVMVNAIAITLRFKIPDSKRNYKMPLNIGPIPVISVLGLISASYVIVKHLH